MGEYRLSIYLVWQFGIAISYEYRQILLKLPFLTIHIATSKYAKGFGFFVRS